MNPETQHLQHAERDHASSGRPSRTVFQIVLCVFLVAIGFFLWTEHRAHLLGALPYVLLLCPAMHLFMHRGHGHGGHAHDHRGDQ